MEIEIHDTVADVRRAAAAAVADYLREGGTNVALSGGSTPGPVHRLLAAESLPWKNITLWLGDERWVPPDDDESNARLARETLADDVDALFLAPDTTGSDPEIAAAHYEIGLRAALPVDDDGRLRPGLMMLGMGDDGHTASLFPGTRALDEMDRDYVANRVESKHTWRLTATFPTLWAAEKLLFVVTGAVKAPVLREILHDAAPYPAQRAAAGAADVTWILDAAAARDLAA